MTSSIRTIPPTKVVLFMKHLLTGSIATRARDPTTRLAITYRKFGTAGPIRGIGTATSCIEWNSGWQALG
jgi:hypothetical protein